MARVFSNENIGGNPVNSNNSRDSYTYTINSNNTTSILTLTLILGSIAAGVYLFKKMKKDNLAIQEELKLLKKEFKENKNSLRNTYDTKQLNED